MEMENSKLQSSLPAERWGPAGTERAGASSPCHQPVKTAASWPRTAKQLEAAGWTDTRRSKWCSCGQIIFWFLSPAKKYVPLSVKVISTIGESLFLPHIAVCTDLKNFRHAARPDKKAKAPKPVQADLFDGAAR